MEKGKGMEKPPGRVGVGAVLTRRAYIQVLPRIEVRLLFQRDFLVGLSRLLFIIPKQLAITVRLF